MRGVGRCAIALGLYIINYQAGPLLYADESKAVVE